jgi:hypothetical protein
MLTRMFPAVTAGARPFATGVIALALLGTAVTSAQAGRIRSTQCAGGWFYHISCVTQWGEATDPYLRAIPGPRSVQEEADFAERDRKWVAYCRPVIKPDRYGVERYHYAAPGCEHGRIKD